MLKNRFFTRPSDIFEAVLCFDEKPSGKYTRYVHIIASLLPILFLWFHYHNVITYWWMGDDPVFLWVTIEKGIISHFYKPDVWRSFSGSFFTPWINLSFGLDWHLFGLEPRGFYWHHIVSFTLVLLAAYRVLTLYFHPVLTSIILTLFTLSVPSATVVQTLMVRHYLEGFALTLAAYYCYVVADRSNKYRWSCAGAFFYLLAVTAKEIYVPLLVILPILSISSGQKKFKMIIPFIFVAVFYILWRAYMLSFENVLSGYQLLPKPGLTDFIGFPEAVAQIMGFNHFWQKAVMVIACFSVLITTNKRLSYTYAVLGLWFIIILAPIVPVIKALDARYLFIPSFMIFVFIGNNILNIWKNNTYRVIYRVFAVCLTVSLFLTIFKTTDSEYRNNQSQLADRFRKEGEFVLCGSDDQSSLIYPVSASYCYVALKWLRQNVLSKSLGPSVCFEPYLCGMLKHQKVYQYINHELLQVAWPDIKDDLRRVDNTADLFFEMSYALGKINWSFGPYTNGTYYLVNYDQLNTIFGNSVQLPSNFAMSLQLQVPLSFILEYESPDGWKTFSPAMVLDPFATDASGAVHLQWKRN